MTRILLAASALVLALASPSLAADMGRPAYKPVQATPYYVAGYSWTGFYLGINGGYGWGKADITNPTAAFTTGTTNGWLFGGTAGYNLQTGNFVFGIEGDIDYALIKGNATNVTTCGIGTCEVKDTWFATARGRVGYAFDRWMPFLTGGAAFAGLKVLPSTGASSTGTSTGWTIGGGIEWAFAGPWSAKAEYLYADLGSSTCEAAICGVSTEFRPKINVVRAGLNYRF
jgi:outer membrane immunogenic protein